jgi:hypothetical protein
VKENICVDKAPSKKAEIKTSAGGANAYRFECERRDGEIVNYGICHLVIDMIRNNTMISSDWLRCKPFIEAGTCPALTMMEQERQAKKVLFFEYYPSQQPPHKAPEVKTPLPQPMTFTKLPSHMIVNRQVSREAQSEPKTFEVGEHYQAPKPSLNKPLPKMATTHSATDDFLGGLEDVNGYAAAINNAVIDYNAGTVTPESAPSAPVEPSPAPEAPTPVPSARAPSLIEIARAMAAKKGSAQ